MLPQDFRRAPVKTRAERERGLRAFEKLVAHIQSRPDSEVISARRLHDLYRDRLVGERLTIDEVAALAEAMVEEITFQPVGGQYVSAAEVFGLVVSALARCFRTGHLPRSLPVRHLGGPPRAAATARRQGPLSPVVLAHVLADVAGYVRFHGRVPAEAWRGNDAISTGDFLATAAHALVALHRTGEPPESIELLRGNVTCLQYAPERAEVSTWPSFPVGFADRNGVSHARLQCWTLKPAVAV